MPRKRKGPKREPSLDTATGAVSPTDLADSIAAPSTSTSHRDARNASERQASTAPRSSVTHHIATAVHSSKRIRRLEENEEDRLGRLVGLDRFIESIGNGRGAAVCVCGEASSIQEPAASGDDALTLILACIDPNEPSRRVDLTVEFEGPLIQAVLEPLRFLQRLGPPAILYMSGFAAEVNVSPAGTTILVFSDHKVILKMSPQSTSHDPAAPTTAIWIEQLNKDKGHPASSAVDFRAVNTSAVQSRRSVSAPSASARPQQTSHTAPSQSATAAAGNLAVPTPPSQVSDWFSTPAPESNAQYRTVAESTNVVAEPSTQRPTHLGQQAESPANPQPVVKSEGLNRSSSSPHPSRPPSRQASANPQRRKAPPVKPRRMGGCIYTPTSMLRDGERANLIGIVMASGDPRRASGGTRDLSIRIIIADASCITGTGYAKEVSKSITVMLFARETERIPQSVKPGQILAVRGVHIQMFSGRPQAVGKAALVWEWAIYDPVSGDVQASPNFPLASITPPECSVEEMEHFREMANWFSELQGVDGNVVARSSRPTLKLKDITENVFFDTVVEVVKVFTHTLTPDLYVTDYTNHMLCYRGNDKYLNIDSALPYPDETDGWGYVFQISLWDSHATIAEGLQTGDIIRIQNIRPKMNPRGLLQGGLGNSSDSGIKVRTLKATDEARIELEKARAQFKEILFAAEEDAVADQVEREALQASQQSQQSALEGAQSRAHHVLADERQGTVAPSASVEGPVIDHEQADAGERATTVASAVDAVKASPLSATQESFPTPAQRSYRPAQSETPSRTRSLGTATSTNRQFTGLLEPDSPESKSHVLMGPPGVPMEERRPLIKCNAPPHIPLTPLAILPATSLCPSMYKVQARIIGTNPTKVEQWGRVECKACKKLLPIDQRFCVKCGDEEGESLSYCLRFAVMLEEVDAEYIERKKKRREEEGQAASSELTKASIPVLFHGRSSEVLIPCVDAKALYNGEKASIKTLRRFHNRLLHPKEYGKDPEQVLAVSSYWSKESGKTVRRFAALKELNRLTNPAELL